MYEERQERIERKLDLVLALLQQLAKGTAIMSTAIDNALADLNAKLTAETNASVAAETLLTSINAQLKDALALGDPAAIASQITAVSAALDKNTAGLAAAVVANTPAAPPAPSPAPAPVPAAPPAPTT